MAIKLVVPMLILAALLAAATVDARLPRFDRAGA